ncbi:MAG: hypothetical protein RLZZ265_511 [Verrucomicrobiota bacterium]|jgi:hypothetical protein
MIAEIEPLLVALIVLAAVGVGVGFFSIGRGRKNRGLCGEAEYAIEQGQDAEALKLLLAAERSWAFNSHDGSTASRLVDLEDYLRILKLLSRLASDNTAPCIARTEELVGELRALFSNRAHFGIDGRSMKPDAAARWVELSTRFETLRGEFRAKGESALAAADADAAPHFVIEHPSMKDHGPCECCGCMSRLVTGLVRRHGEQYACFQVNWTLGQLARHGASVYVILGRWGDDATAADRFAVAMHYRNDAETRGLMIVDADQTSIATNPLVGRTLRRDEVVGTPLADEVFELIDFLWLTDGRLAELASSSSAAARR